MPACRSEIVASSNSNGETASEGDGSGANSRAPANAGSMTAVAPPRKVDFKNFRRGGSSEDRKPFGFIVPPNDLRRRNYRPSVKFKACETNLLQTVFDCELAGHETKQLSKICLGSNGILVTAKDVL